MNQCWKCGREVPFGLECDPPCNGDSRPVADDDDDCFKASDFAEIDWDKVKTFEDLKLIVQELGWCNMVYKKSEEYQKLKKFIKEDITGGNRHD